MPAVGGEVLMKYLLILIFLSANSHAKFLEACKNLFISPKLKIQWSSKQKFTQPYSQKLFDKLYSTVSNWNILSQTEKQKYIIEIEKSISFIESHSHTYEKLNIMNPQLIKAIEAFPQLLKFVNENQNQAHLNTKQSLEIALVSLTKYTMAFIKHNNNDKLDLARWSAIMQAIANFEKEPNAFSVYKIIRAVKEKHSLYEFLNCK